MERKSLIRLVSGLLAAVGLAGCATQEKFIEKANGFIGQPESALIQRLGLPQSEYTGSDGTKYLQYRWDRSMVIGGGTQMVPVTTNTTGTSTLSYGAFGAQHATGQYSGTSTTYVPQQVPGTPINLNCTLVWAVRDGVIRSWSAQGNNCVSNG